MTCFQRVKDSPVPDIVIWIVRGGCKDKLHSIVRVSHRMPAKRGHIYADFRTLQHKSLLRPVDALREKFDFTAHRDQYHLRLIMRMTTAHHLMGGEIGPKHTFRDEWQAALELRHRDVPLHGAAYGVKFYDVWMFGHFISLFTTMQNYAFSRKVERSPKKLVRLQTILYVCSAFPQPLLPSPMFLKKTLFALLPFAALSCANDPKIPTANTPPPVVTDLKGKTILDLCYATSVAPGNSMDALFDGNAATVWSTAAGTGTDEGIFVGFQQEQDMGKLVIDAVDGSFKQQKDVFPTIQVFANGKPVARGLPGEAIDIATNKVKSLYIRFEATGQEQRTNSKAQEGTALETFPGGASVALRGIQITNARGEALSLVAPAAVAGSVTASSTLAPESAYSPSNLFDGRKEFVWVEGSSGSGEGESLVFAFERPVRMSALQVWNGYQRSDEHFSANARVKTLEIGVDGGAVQTIDLQDVKGSQRIDLPQPLSGQKVTLRVKSAYPGSKYKDLALSELVFYDGDAPFVARTDFSQRNQATLKGQAAGSALAPLLDRRVFNESTDGDYQRSAALTLRSDGTFVYYNVEGMVGNSENETETYADGNWQWVSGNTKEARIKIFGQWRNLSKVEDYYKGASTQQFMRIFNDVLTVQSNKIEGSKMLGVFYTE
jgi:hypothetical protein